MQDLLNPAQDSGHLVSSSLGGQNTIVSSNDHHKPISPLHLSAAPRWISHVAKPQQALEVDSGTIRVDEGR